MSSHQSDPDWKTRRRSIRLFRCAWLIITSANIATITQELWILGVQLGTNQPYLTFKHYTFHESLQVFHNQSEDQRTLACDRKCWPVATLGANSADAVVEQVQRIDGETRVANYLNRSWEVRVRRVDNRVRHIEKWTSHNGWNNEKPLCTSVYGGKQLHLNWSRAKTGIGAKNEHAQLLRIGFRLHWKSVFAKLWTKHKIHDALSHWFLQLSK